MKKHIKSFGSFSINEAMEGSIKGLSGNQYYHAGYHYQSEYEWSENDNINTKDLQVAKDFVIKAIKEARFPEWGNGLFYIVIFEVNEKGFSVPSINDSGSRGEVTLEGKFDEVLVMEVSEDDKEESIAKFEAL